MYISEDQAKRFLNGSSFIGLASIRVLHLSYTKKMAFHYDEAFAKLFPESVDYCYGFIVACSSIGICSYNFKNRIMTVTHLDDLVAAGLVKSLEDKSTGFPDRVETLRLIQDYFA